MTSDPTRGGLGMWEGLGGLFCLGGNEMGLEGWFRGCSRVLESHWGEAADHGGSI